MSTKKKPVASAPTKPAEPAPTIMRHSVLPEIASLVREEGDALAATIATAQAMADAATASAQSLARQAVAKRTAAMRPILRQLGYDDETVTITDTEGTGVNTVLVIESVAEVPRG